MQLRPFLIAFHCAAAAACLPTLAIADTITLNGTIRDFNSAGTTNGHPDFESKSNDDRGIVQSLLGADGKPVYNAGDSNPTVTSAASFYQWYHDDATVNRTASISLTLDKVGNLYQYSNSSFFPIDNQLWGNQGKAHNYGFTTEFHTTFGFDSSISNLFTFSGDDDVFVFINGHLAIDLGGVHGTESATVDLNAEAAALGITSGNNYTLDVFQAERRTVGSTFSMTTTLQLQSQGVPEPGSLALVGLALAGLGLARRRG